MYYDHLFYEKHKLEGMCECHLLIQKDIYWAPPILYYNVKLDHDPWE